jgi:hypothetical protein
MATEAVCQTISTRADLATTFFFAAQATFALILSPYFYQRSVASPQLGDIRRDPPRLILGKHFRRRSPLWSRTTKQAGCSSIDQGGGKRRWLLAHTFLMKAFVRNQ